MGAKARDRNIEKIFTDLPTTISIYLWIFCINGVTSLQKTFHKQDIMFFPQ